MNIFVDLKAALLTRTAVTALVGDDIATPARIWNSWPRTYVDPCLIMDVDDGRNQVWPAARATWSPTDATLTCRADTHNVSDTLAAAVKDLLGGWNGTFQAILEHTGDSETPKGDGSTAHWYDRVMS